MIAYLSINQQNTSLTAQEEYFRSLQKPQEKEASVFLQTCNRMELYYGEGELPDEVARHLFRVTSGLESALIGEQAVQGQVKEAYLQARQNSKLSTEMHKLFEMALQTGKRVRTETDISHGAVSHSLAAIEIIEKEHINLSQARITIIGVNKLTSDILKFLKNKGAKMVFLANRSQIKAHNIADPLGIEVFQLKDKADFLPQTDILISATSAPHLIINKEDIHPEQRLLAIDLAFPRDIDARLAELPNITLYNIRDVEQQVQQNISVRESEVQRAEAIIEEGIAELQAILQRRKQYQRTAI
ncbi:MAG: glutamyl-tRNA reductase [Bacteroidaceae bacterium]|nr:glutamyl-tRNA reductase [Bacteroidaceae bacterium]